MDIQKLATKMDVKLSFQKLAAKIEIIKNILLTKKEVKKEDKKNYKYKKDEWEEILKGNDYY
jgi:hypothetical protein|tara:strand:+ start:172 stop:357 length:186 start_codon:yes stop_codon:yes gene_type:complete